MTIRSNTPPPRRDALRRAETSAPAKEAQRAEKAEEASEPEATTCAAPEAEAQRLDRFDGTALERAGDFSGGGGRRDEPVVAGESVLSDDATAALRASQYVAGGARRTPSTFNPVGADAGEAVSAAAARLAPDDVTKLSRRGLLDAVDDAKLSMEIPLKPGTYQIKGFDVRVKPGTKAYVTAEVRDGQLIPSKGKNGTGVRIDPPLDGPLFFDSEGVFLKGENGRGRLVADVGPFDFGISDRGGLGLGETVDRVLGPEGKPKKSSAGDAFGQMMRLDKARIRAAEVKLKDDVLDLGPMKVDVGRGSKIELESSADGRTTLTGRLAVDGIAANKEGLHLDAGAGSADVRVTTQTRRDGTLAIDAQLSGIETEAKALALSSPGRDGAGDDRLALSDVTLKKGRVDLEMALSPSGDVSSKVRAQGEVSGRIEPSKLSISDRKGGSALGFSAGHFSGKIDAGSDQVVMSGELKNVGFEVKDLQTENQGARLDLHHARFEGESASFKVDSRRGQFEAKMKARDVDIRIDDFQGGEGGVSADLGRTEVKGSGTVSVSQKGLRIVGDDLRVSGQIDDFKVKPDLEGGSARFDLAESSKYQGRVRKLAVDSEAGFELDATAAVDLRAESADLKLPNIEGTSSGRIHGQADLKIDDKGFELSNANIAADLNVQKGRLGGKSDVVNLALDKGTTASLKLSSASFKSADGGPTMQVGHGSSIKAKLSGGALHVGDNTFAFKPGAEARFDVDAAGLDAKGQPYLRGRLGVEAEGTLTNDMADKLAAQGVNVAPGTEAATRLNIEEVELRKDGALSLHGVDLEVDAEIGKLTAATRGSTTVRPTAPGAEAVPLLGDGAPASRAGNRPATPTAPTENARPRARAATPEARRLQNLLDSSPGIETNQHLINHFILREGDGTFDDGAKVAQRYGLDLNALTRDRGGSARANLDDVAAAPATVAEAPRASSPATSAPVETAGAAPPAPVVEKSEGPTVPPDPAALRAPGANTPVGATMQAATVQPPPGLHPKSAIELKNASDIAGIKAPTKATDPAALARNIQNGTLELAIPVEGMHGSGLSKVRFDPGTELRVKVAVKDGNIVKDSFEGSLVDKNGQPTHGDAIGPVVLEGLELDKDNDLNLKLGMRVAGRRLEFPDITAVSLGEKPDLMASEFGIVDIPDNSKLPAQRFVDGLSSKFALDKDDKSPNAFQVDKARVEIRDAQFKDTTLDTPFGQLRLDEKSRLNLSRGADGNTVLEGDVSVDGLDVATQAFAMKGKSGSAHLKFAFTGDGDNSHMRAELTKLNLDVEDTVFKNGSDYFHLARGHTEGATLVIEGGTSEESRVAVDLPKVDGDIHSARIESRAGAESRVEMGRTSFSGELTVDNGQLLRLDGRVSKGDIAAHNLELATEGGMVELEGARLKGDGHLTYSGGRLTARDGSLEVEAIVDRSRLWGAAFLEKMDKTVLADGRTYVRGSLEDFKRIEASAARNGEGELETRIEVEGGRAKARVQIDDVVGRLGARNRRR